MMTEFNEAGQELWDAVQQTFKVSAIHKPMLVNACRIADNLDRISRCIENETMTITSVKGEEVANPLLGEHRQQLLALRAILNALGIEKMATNRTGRKTVAEAMEEARAQREGRLAVVK